MFFVFQSIASTSLLVFIIIEKSSKIEEKYSNTFLLIICSIIIKIGLYPFYFWALDIRKILRWINIIVLITWQKIIPIFILIKILKKINIWWILIISIFIINIILIKISNTKIILISSSLIHSRWIILSSKFLIYFPLIYLTIYSIILMINTKLIKIRNRLKLPFQKLEKKNKNLLIISIFRIRGIPPSIGFFIKITIIYSIIKIIDPYWIIIATLLVASIRFFVYFQISYKNITIDYNHNKIYPSYYKFNRSFIFFINTIIFLLFYNFN